MAHVYEVFCLETGEVVDLFDSCDESEILDVLRTFRRLGYRFGFSKNGRCLNLMEVW